MPTLGRRSRLPGAGAKPIFFFFAKKKKTVLDAKRKRRGYDRCPFFFHSAARMDWIGSGSRRHWAAQCGSLTWRDVSTAHAAAASGA